MSSSSPSHSEAELKGSNHYNHTSSSKPRRKLWIWISALLALVVILALALGLGLGLGLRNKKDDNKISASSSSNAHFIERSKLVDPSQMAPSRDWNVNQPPTTREYFWELTRITSNPGGVTKPMLAVNGISPGPLVEANLGDQIVVHVKNSMNILSSIHWHGQLQNGTNFMDGTTGITECGIPPANTFTYNFTVQNVGTYWWHAHAGAQYSDGLYGALVLHSPDEPLKFENSTSTNHSTQENSPVATVASSNSTYDEDLIFMVSDIYNSYSTQALADYLNNGGPSGEGDEPTPDGGIVNGIGKLNCNAVHTGQACDGGGNFEFTVKSNKIYRFRVINVGSLANIRFSVDGHPLTVVEADGTPIEPQVVQSLSVSVAQRYSVLIETNASPGSFFVRGEVLTDMFAYDNPGIVTEQNAIMRYEGTNMSSIPSDSVPALPNSIPVDLDATTLKPLLAIDPPRSTTQQKSVITFGRTADYTFRAFFNSTSWDPQTGNATIFQTVEAQEKGISTSNIYDPDSQFVVTYDDTQVVDFIFNNQDDGSHPFHLHGHTPYLIGTGPGNFLPSSLDLTQDFKNPMRRDVFIIPTYSWAVIRFVTDNPGMWALHCHLASHMEAGLLMQISSQPSKLAQQPIPRGSKEQCQMIQANNITAM